MIVTVGGARRHSQPFGSACSGPSIVGDFLPLTALPELKRLHLGEVSLGREPHLSELTQLGDFALLDQVEVLRPHSLQQEQWSSATYLVYTLNDLFERCSLHRLQMVTSQSLMWREIVIPEPIAQRMQSLLLGFKTGFHSVWPQMLDRRFSRLRVLGLVGLPADRMKQCLSLLKLLPSLEALSLAAYGIDRTEMFSLPDQRKREALCLYWLDLLSPLR